MKAFEGLKVASWCWLKGGCSSCASYSPRISHGRDVKWCKHLSRSLSLYSNFPWHIPDREAYIKVALPSELNFHKRNRPCIFNELQRNIATQERKVLDMEIEMVMFVVNGKCNRQELIQVGSRNDALRFAMCSVWIISSLSLPYPRVHRKRRLEWGVSE